MIHRDGHEDNFTVLNNAAIEDKNISAEAFRLLVFMLSCADTWQFSLKGLAVRLGIPERTLSSRITELRHAGYLKTVWSTNANGRFEACEWEVYEVPMLTASQENCNAVEPQRGKTATRSDRNAETPHRGNPATTKQILIETNTNRKQILKETSTKDTRVFVKPTLEEIAAYCKERGNSVDPQKFIDHYDSNGWRVGKNPMKDWRAAVRTWEKTGYDSPKRSKHAKWRTGAEAGLKTETETRAPVSKLNDTQDIPNDILDLFGN